MSTTLYLMQMQKNDKQLEYFMKPLESVCDSFFTETREPLIQPMTEYFLSALGGDKSLVEPFLLGHIKATVIGGQLFVAELPGTGIVGVGLWFGPGQKFLSR
jgi:hypothetical protein